MNISLFAFHFISFIGSIGISSAINKPHCTAGEAGCVDDRTQRDATLTIIEYDNQHAVCDDDHPFFCDIVDPFYGIKDKLKNSLSVDEFARKVLPLDVHKQNKKNYKSSKGNENMESMQKSNVPDSDGFVCAENGFFPDYNNHKMFYHCARSSHGESFVVHHRMCPSGLTFNGFNKKCDVNQLKYNRNEQTTRQTKTAFMKKQEFKEFFHCSHTGLFPDKFNASMFWYCERNRKNGFTVSKMLCPDGETFDPAKKSCVFADERFE